MKICFSLFKVCKIIWGFKKYMNCRFYPIKATKFIRPYLKDNLLRTASLPSLPPPFLPPSRLFFLYKISTFKGKFVVTYKDHSYNQFSSVQFSRSVVSDSLQPHESQHARPPCPSPTLGVHSNSCPSSWWCNPTISSSVVPFSSCP